MQQHYLVPHHTSGAETDISHSMEARNTGEAEDIFIDAMKNLVDVAHWAKCANLPGLAFALADAHLRPIRRSARSTDHIHITRQHTGTGHDAYTIDALEYDDYPDTNAETFAIRMHPSGQQPGTGTATLVIERRGHHLSAHFHGRNNTATHPALWSGLTPTEWQELMRGLLEYYEE